MYKLATEYFKEKKVLPYQGKGRGKKLSDLIKDGRSEYKIVLSVAANECEIYAAEELRKYVLQATKVTLEIVSESKETELGGKWIAIGDTELAKKADLDTNDLNFDGFRLKTEGETLLIKGQRTRGTLYGVYDFLEKFLCVRFLTKTFEYVPETKEVPFYELDIKEIPDFASRSHHVGVVIDTAYATKRRMVAPFAIEGEDTKKYGGGFLDDWTGDMHSFKYLLPYEQYGEKHPEWYSTTDRWQPVMSNGLNDDGTINEAMEESVVKEMVKNVKKIVYEHPDARYVSFSQNDNYNFSQHPDCVRQREIFGGYGGHQIAFANVVAKEVKRQLKEEGVERELYFVVFGYHQTETPPVKLDENGELVPVHKAAIPRDDVIVMLTEYECSYTEPIKANSIDDFNYIYYMQNEGWAKITKHLFIFDYDVNYHDTLSWFPNTEVIIPNLQYYKKIGVTGLWTEGAHGGNHYQEALHNYLWSKLHWNIDQDLDALISEFNALMFGPEAGYMIDRLVRYIRGHFKAEANKGDGYVKPAQIYTQASPWLTSAETLNYNFLTECERLVDGAKWHIRTRTNYDEKTKEQYLHNLRYVEVTLGYMKLKNYDALFDRDCKRQFVEKFASDVKAIGEKYYCTSTDDHALSIEALIEANGVRMGTPRIWKYAKKIEEMLKK